MYLIYARLPGKGLVIKLTKMVQSNYGIRIVPWLNIDVINTFSDTPTFDKTKYLEFIKNCIGEGDIQAFGSPALRNNKRRV